MESPLKKIGERLAKAVIDTILDPIRALQAQVDALAATVEAKHITDPQALECDLSVLDDRICSLIDNARARGYTTASERRRVSRMHKAYQDRGGNHGEEEEYLRYTKLPTEEDWQREQMKGEQYGTESV